MSDPMAVRAIDTNVLLRYLLDDIPEQAERCRRLVDSTEMLGVTAVVLAEAAWTLTSGRYRRDRVAVARSLETLLERENIVTIGMQKAEALAALVACEAATRAPNFGDALIAACARSAGLFDIYTFDAEFERAGLRALPLP